MQDVQTDNAPKAIGPYSQAIAAGNFVFCSGQIALNPETGQLTGETAAEQTKQAIQNVREILKAAGLNLSHVVQTHVYLKNISDFASMNEVYQSEFVSLPYPARVTVGVASLPKDALVEIAAVAYKE